MGHAIIRASLVTPVCLTGHNYIGTEHILLGLLREGEGVAARVLETLGADPSKIRTQVRPTCCICMLSYDACLSVYFWSFLDMWRCDNCIEAAR